MSIEAFACPHCTAPIAPDGWKSAVCAYCRSVLVGLPRAWWARPVPVPPWSGRSADAGAPRVRLGERAWVLGARLGVGAHSEVFRARRDARLPLGAVLKVATDDGEALRRELRVIRRLRQSAARGTDHFVRRLPAPVASGALRGDAISAGGAPFAVAYRARPGFTRTLADVRGAVDPRVAVWVGKRLLEQLTWLHGAGFAHRAIAAEHVLVHERDHGATLIGWSEARWLGGGDRASHRADVAAALEVAGALLDRRAPRALRRFFHAAGSTDAWARHAALVRVSAETLGAPRHAPLNAS